MSNSVDPSTFECVFYINVRRRIIMFLSMMLFSCVTMAVFYFLGLKYFPQFSLILHIGFGAYFVLLFLYLIFAISYMVKKSGKLSIGLKKEGIFILPNRFIDWKNVDKIQILKSDDGFKKVQLTLNENLSEGKKDLGKEIFILRSDVDTTLEAFLKILKEYHEDY